MLSVVRKRETNILLSDITTVDVEILQTVHSGHQDFAWSTLSCFVYSSTGIKEISMLVKLDKPFKIRKTSRNLPKEDTGKRI